MVFRSERAGKVTPLENIEGHNIQGRAAYGKQLKSSRGRGNLGERIGMDKKRDHVTPTKVYLLFIITRYFFIIFNIYIS